MSFHVGQKVVCVDDARDPSAVPVEDYGVPWLEKGKLYVVRESFTSNIGSPVIIPIGYPDCFWKGFKLGFPAYRFRALEELQQESKERYHVEHPIRA